MGKDESTLEKDIEMALNRHSRENASNTPDFILAAYLMACLEAFERTSVRREAWYGKYLTIEGTTPGLSGIPTTFCATCHGIKKAQLSIAYGERRRCRCKERKQ